MLTKNALQPYPLEFTMFTLLLTTLLACGNKEEDTGLIHISNDGPAGEAFPSPHADRQMERLFVLLLVGKGVKSAQLQETPIFL